LWCLLGGGEPHDSRPGRAGHVPPCPAVAPPLSQRPLTWENPHGHGRFVGLPLRLTPSSELSRVPSCPEATAAYGCSSGSATLKNAPANAAPGCAEKIQVFASAQEVPRPYETLCMVNAQTSGIAGNKGNVNLVLNKGKARACECVPRL
jgi:hypothetical protein